MKQEKEKDGWVNISSLPSNILEELREALRKDRVKAMLILKESLEKLKQKESGGDIL